MKYFPCKGKLSDIVPSNIIEESREVLTAYGEPAENFKRKLSWRLLHFPKQLSRFSSKAAEALIYDFRRAPCLRA